MSIAALDPFPDKPVFKNCRKMHQKLKYSAGKFTLRQVSTCYYSLCAVKCNGVPDCYSVLDILDFPGDTRFLIRFHDYYRESLLASKTWQLEPLFRIYGL